MTREARVLWDELATLYDALERHVAAAAWAEAAGLAPRMRALETALQPFVAARRAASSADEIATWAPFDAMVAALATRQANAVAAARAARDAIAAELARNAQRRTEAARYRGTARTTPVFASRIA